MSDVTDAFDVALDAAEEARGERKKVTFRGQELDCLINEDEQDFVPVGPGMADAAPTILSMRTDDVEPPILHLESITVNGVIKRVLKHAFLAGRVRLTVGDPSEEVD